MQLQSSVGNRRARWISHYAIQRRGRDLGKTARRKQENTGEQTQQPDGSRQLSIPARTTWSTRAFLHINKASLVSYLTYGVHSFVVCDGEYSTALRSTSTLLTWWCFTYQTFDLQVKREKSKSSLKWLSISFLGFFVNASRGDCTPCVFI